MNQSAGVVIVMLLLVVVVAGVAFYFYTEAQAAELKAAMLASSLKAEQNKGGVANIFTGLAKAFQGKF